MLQKISRGDVYFYDFGFDYDGSVEGKNRPCVIISNDKGNNYGTTALVAPITTRSKESCKPWQVHFQNGTKSQIILCEQIKTVNIAKLYRYQGKLDALTMKAVDEALTIEFDLNVTQREQDSVEFLYRLDIALMKITNNHLNNYDKKINEIITNALYTANSCKDKYEELCNNVVNKVTEVVSNNKDVIDGITEIKSIFNKNAENIDKILSSLINLYKDMNSKQEHINIHNLVEKGMVKELEKQVDSKILETVTESNKTISKSIHSRYTVDYAKEFIKDYYNMERKSFMSKYNLKDTVMINNRLTTMKNLLKRNNIDWKNIKNNITIYNVNDLSEEEKQTKFSKYLKKNETLSIINTTDKTCREPEEYGLNDTSNYKGGCGLNKGCKLTHRAEAFEYSVENCLAFVDECNKYSINELCEKYDLTKKQFSNRKYLICKWLKDQGVSFKIVKYKRI